MLSLTQASTLLTALLAAGALPSCYRQMSTDVAGVSSLSVDDLRVESQQDPIGIDADPPQLSWTLHAQRRGVMQSSYQIRAAASPQELRDPAALLFDSGKVGSGQSVHVRYGGPRPSSRQRVYWQVRAWDSLGSRSEWSEPGFWEMGLLSPDAWHARWIEPQTEAEPRELGPAPLLRATFQLDERVVRARAYVSSRGLYEIYLNGVRVGDQLFTPGWTSYAHRTQYQTYDVTSLVKSGANAIGAVLGDGWYRGAIGRADIRDLYGDALALFAQVEITHASGKVTTVVSDAHWKAAVGPIRSSDIYAGEVYDARLEKRGWSEAGYDDRDWRLVKVVPSASGMLVAPVGPPVRRIEELKPVRSFRSPAGLDVFDMGQNMVGFVRLRAKGRAGTTITLRHGEVLDPNRNVYTDNLLTARQTTQYTLRGGGEEVFEPHFSYQGFRYVSVHADGPVDYFDVAGVVVHADMAQTGTLETSSPAINQLQHNILWSQKGNFFSVPTDCPQRSERLGWTADAQLFSATAAINMDVAGFYRSWLNDLAAEQNSEGAVPWFVPFPPRFPVLPNMPRQDTAGMAAWGDAATVVPWNMYLAYGDVDALRSMYPTMARWVEYERKRAGPDHIWSGDYQLGDWLDLHPPDASKSEPSDFGATSPDMIATAYYAHSVDVLRRAARVLARAEDAERYTALLANIERAFQSRFVSEEGRVANGTQTAYVLALDFDLLPEILRPTAAHHLVTDLRTRGHLTTGLLGTARLLNVLSRFGYTEDAYRLLNRKEFPSWLYSVTHGATTLWERWDGVGPDGSFHDPGMNSFNHYWMGAVGEWLYRVMAGLNIDPEVPGYKHSLIQPEPGGGITHVKATIETRYGRLSSEWTLQGGAFRLVIQVPPNTHTSVRLPHARLAEVLESGLRASDVSGVRDVRQEGENVLAEVSSGEYEFSYPWSDRTQDLVH